jgi:hypothetical protein
MESYMSLVSEPPSEVLRHEHCGGSPLMLVSRAPTYAEISSRVLVSFVCRPSRLGLGTGIYYICSPWMERSHWFWISGGVPG